MMLGGWFLKNYQLWVRGVLISLAASLVVFSFVSRKPLCIDSRVVEKIDIVSNGPLQGLASSVSLQFVGEPVATAYRCSQLRHVDFNQDLSEAVQNLSKRLPRLEKYVELLGPIVGKVHLVVRLDGASNYYIDNKKIFLSVQSLKQPEIFERAFLQFWLRQKNVDKSVVYSMNEEIFIDFLYYAFSGKIEYLKSQYNLALWPQLLSGVDDYCVSIIKYNKDIDFCKRFLLDSNNTLFKSLAVPEKKHESLWVQESVRPLITSSLVSVFQKLTTSERLLLLQKITESLSDSKLNVLGLLYNREDDKMISSSLHFKTISEIHNFIHSWYTYLAEIDDMQGSVRFSKMFSQELELRGYNLEVEKQTIDGLIFTSNIHEENLIEYREQLQSIATQGQFALLGKNNLEWIAQAKFIAADSIANLKAKKGVVLTCGFGDIKSLMSYAKKVDRLLLIDSCQNQTEQKINIEAYFKSGAKHFASKNKQVRFIEFHSSSLLSAMAENSTEHLIGLMLQKKHPANEKKYDSALMQHLGWTQTLYDQALDIYQPQSVIDFVNYFRL